MSLNSDDNLVEEILADITRKKKEGVASRPPNISEDMEDRAASQKEVDEAIRLLQEKERFD